MKAQTITDAQKFGAFAVFRKETSNVCTATLCVFLQILGLLLVELHPESSLTGRNKDRNPSYGVPTSQRVQHSLAFPS